jgi:Flp pilus assembly CpaE family ATPase
VLAVPRVLKTPDMSQPVLNVLLIEGDSGGAGMVSESLAEAGAFQVFRATDLLRGLRCLAKGNIDLVLLDLALPDSRGLDGLKAVRALAPSTPVVLLASSDSESLASQALSRGAQDYVVKGARHGPGLIRTLQHAIFRQRAEGDSGFESGQEPAEVVGFLGTQGGVGNTTIACHAALELRRQTRSRVLLMDLDVGADAVGFMMNVNSPYSLLDASNDIPRLDRDRWAKLTGSGGEGLDIIRSGGPACREEEQPDAERVRFVLRFARSLYRWIVVDLGRLTPFSMRLAEEMGRLSLVSTCDLLALNGAKSATTALLAAGFDRDRLSLILNQSPARPGLSRRELGDLLGVSVEVMLPECNHDVADSCAEGKRLVESHKFQKEMVDLAARIACLGKYAPSTEPRGPSLIGAFRNAPARA